MVFQSLLTNISIEDHSYKFFDLTKLKDSRYEQLPISIRYLLESAVRYCDEFHVTKSDVETILDWQNTQFQSKEIPFKPARVLLQDFT